MKMPPKAQFTPAPEGLHIAVCCDFVDLGEIEKNFGSKPEKVHCVQYRFQSSEINPETEKPWLILTGQLKLSSDDRSNLMKMLVSWRGKFKDDELETFEYEDMIGTMAQITVAHNKSSTGKVYANISAIMPVMKGTKPLAVRDYVRVCDRKDGDGGSNGGTMDTEESDHVPF